MLTTLVVGWSLIWGSLVAPAAAPVPPPAPRPYRVVDLAPVGNITESSLVYEVTIRAQRPEKKPLTWAFVFSPDKSPAQIRDAAFRSLERLSCKVQKVGDTKILFYGCQKLEVTTEAPGRKEFPLECRPTVKAYKDEKEALEGK